MSAAKIVKKNYYKPFNCENHIKFGWFRHFFEVCVLICTAFVFKPLFKTKQYERQKN